MTELRDPSKPAGHLVEQRDDGSALRNDGNELKPARQNPWYVLMTLAGEIRGNAFSDTNLILSNRNRLLWNGWACGCFTDQMCPRLVKKAGFDEKEIEYLQDEAKYSARDSFFGRLDICDYPIPNEKINLSKLHIQNTFSVENYIFPSATYFSDTIFTKFASFRNCVFNDFTTFRSSYFHERVDFENSEFLRNCYFGLLGFYHEVSFAGAEFFGEAHFEKSFFRGPAVFKDANCSGETNFEAARFEGFASFTNGSFVSKTSFRHVEFRRRVPEFYQRKFHQDTEFSMGLAHWPKHAQQRHETSHQAKRAYTRLAQIMSELHKPDDEQFFRRQEMRCAAVLADGPHRWMYKAYELVSDFGYSIWRPLGWLGGTVAAGWGIMGSYLKHGKSLQGTEPIWDGLAASFANTFAIFRFGAIYFEPSFFRELNPWIKLLGGTQTILGVIFLFFLGLGLRNRFRLK